MEAVEPVLVLSYSFAAYFAVPFGVLSKKEKTALRIRSGRRRPGAPDHKRGQLGRKRDSICQWKRG